MSALEALIATSEESSLMNSLDFSLPPASTAVTDRKNNLRAYPTSQSTLNPTGTRTCRIRLGGDNFCDTQSIRLSFQIHKLDGTNPLVPLCGAWGLWSEMFLRSNGREMDNIPWYGRFHTQYGFNQKSRAEQFGQIGICSGYGSDVAGASSNQPVMGTIAAGASVTVMHELLLSAFQHHKYWPTRYAPLELEVSVNSIVSDWLSQAGGTSQTFEINNVQLLYTDVTLDDAIQESFYKSLISGRLLNIPTMSAYQVVYTVPAN